jgi:hypothetical protein
LFFPQVPWVISHPDPQLYGRDPADRGQPHAWHGRTAGPMPPVMCLGSNRLLFDLWDGFVILPTGEIRKEALLTIISAEYDLY